MDKNICVDFLNAMKNFVNDALKKCEEEKQEETVVAETDDVQVTPEEVTPEEVSQDSIATSKGNEEKETPVVEETTEENETVLKAADETEGDPDTLKNVEAPEEKSDEERLFETAEQLTEIAKQIFEKKEPMTPKQSAFVAKVLVKHAQRIAKYSVKKNKK